MTFLFVLHYFFDGYQLWEYFRYFYFVGIYDSKKFLSQVASVLYDFLCTHNTVHRKNSICKNLTKILGTN